MLCCLMNNQGREPNVCDLKTQNTNKKPKKPKRLKFRIGLYSDIYQPFSFKHGVMIVTTEL